METQHLKYMTTNKFTKETIVLVLVIIVAAFVRIVSLSSVPPHLTPDEASLGYNAYSILKTGRDEHGALFPIIFKSFGDNKPGLYVYFTLPFVALFGLNEFSTRIASALFGVLAVFVLYKIGKYLFSQENKALPLVSAVLLALSPWHIMLSRGAWEVNVALTLTLIGIYFFLRGLTTHKYLYISSCFFALTLLAYQGAKLSSAIVVILLLISFYKKIKKVPLKTWIISVVTGIIISFPIIISLFTGQASRLSVFSVFSAPRPAEFLTNFLNEGNEQKGTIQYYAFHSEGFNFLRGIMGRWFNHFSGRFLFFEGDWQNPRHSAPYVGMLNILDLPLLLFGIYGLIKAKNREVSVFIFLWLILACLPAILSRDQVHAVRSFNMVIPLLLVSTYGVSKLIEIVSHKKVFWMGGIILYLVGFLYFLDAYFVHLPKLNSQYWEYGFKQAVEDVLPIQKNYKTIIFQQSYSQPYIYFLFYGKYDPAKFQGYIANHFIESKFGDVGQVDSLDNIQFKGIDWQILRGAKGTLVVGDSERIPEGDSKEGTEFHVISDIRYLNNKATALRIIEIK